jgi:hypothetical protein
MSVEIDDARMTMPKTRRKEVGEAQWLVEEARPAPSDPQPDLTARRY